MAKGGGRMLCQRCARVGAHGPLRQYRGLRPGLCHHRGATHRGGKKTGGQKENQPERAQGRIAPPSRGRWPHGPQGMRKIRHETLMNFKRRTPHQSRQTCGCGCLPHYHKHPKNHINTRRPAVKAGQLLGVGPQTERRTTNYRRSGADPQTITENIRKQHRHKKTCRETWTSPGAWSTNNGCRG